MRVLPSGATGSRTLSEWLGATHNAKAAGAGAGSNDSPAFGSLFTAALSSGKPVAIPAGDYTLSTNVIPGTGDLALFVDPGAKVTGAGVFRLGNALPYIPQPVTALDLYSRSYNDTDWVGYRNVFQRASFARTTAVRVKNTLPYKPAVVAIFGGCDAAAAGAACWGSNFLGLASADGAVAIADESDASAMAPGAMAYNKVLVSTGLYPAQNAIQIQASKTTNAHINGIVFNNRSATSVDPAGGDTITSDYPAVSGTQILSDAGVGTARFVKISDTVYSASEWESSNFVIGPSTVLGSGQFRSFLRMDGSVTGNPALQAKGGDGTGPVNLILSAHNGGNIPFTTLDRNGPIQARVKHTAGATDYLDLTGGVGDVSIGTAGSSTNSSVSIQGKGNGGAKIRDGAGALKIQTNTTGIGFNGATPVAKCTLAAALPTDGTATNAALATAYNTVRSCLIGNGLAQ